MSLSYTKPTWTNDEGTAINAARLQAISDVISGLVNDEGTKAIVSISFTNENMTLHFADGSIATVSNPNRGEQGPKGDSLTATAEKVGKVTTVTITDAVTGEYVTSFQVLDGQDGGGGSGSGDMLKSVYDADNTVANAGGIEGYAYSKHEIDRMVGDVETLLANL